MIEIILGSIALGMLLGKKCCKNSPKKEDYQHLEYFKTFKQIHEYKFDLNERYKFIFPEFIIEDVEIVQNIENSIRIKISPDDDVKFRSWMIMIEKYFYNCDYKKDVVIECKKGSYRLIGVFPSQIDSRNISSKTTEIVLSIDYVEYNYEK